MGVSDQGALHRTDPDGLEVVGELDGHTGLEVEPGRTGAKKSLGGPVPQQLDRVDGVALRALADRRQQRGIEVEHSADQRSTLGGGERGETEGGAAVAFLESGEGIGGTGLGAKGLLLHGEHNERRQPSVEDPGSQGAGICAPLGIVGMKDGQRTDAIEQSGHHGVASPLLGASPRQQQVESLGPGGFIGGFTEQGVEVLGSFVSLQSGASQDTTQGRAQATVGIGDRLVNRRDHCGTVLGMGLPTQPAGQAGLAGSSTSPNHHHFDTARGSHPTQRLQKSGPLPGASDQRWIHSANPATPGA